MTHQLISKYIEGTCTDAELRYIVTYFEEHPEAIELYFNEAEWKDFLQKEVHIPANTLASDPLFAKIYAQTVVKTKRLKRNLGYGVFFLTVLLVGLGWWLFGIKISPDFELFVQKRKPVLPVSMITWRNYSQQVQSRTLADGSTVRLFPQSELDYVQGLDTAMQRTIRLQGRAHFEVASAPNRPFRVDCKGISTTALGTRFEVDGLAELKILLFEGRVVVEKINDASLEKQYLMPGEQIVYTSAGYRLQKTKGAVLKLGALPTKKAKKMTDTLLYLSDALDDWAYTFQVKVGYTTEVIRGLRVSAREQSAVGSWEEALQLLKETYGMEGVADSTGLYRIVPRVH